MTDYLTVVFRQPIGPAARTLLESGEWTAASHSHAIHDRDEAKQEAEKLRAELEALRKQEPVAWCATDESGEKVEALSFNKSRRRFDTPLYFAAGAQPAPSVSDIVDRMSEFATHDIERGEMMFDKWSLREAVEATIVEAQPAPSVPGRATMIERLKAAVEGECDGLAIDDRHAEAILDYVLAAAPEATKRKPLTDAMVEAAGRALSDRHANGCGCGMDKDIMWSSYSDEFKEQARVALGAAHEIKENSND